MRIKADVRPYGCSTIKELAESIGYSRWTVSNFLRGRSEGSWRLCNLLLERLNKERETAKTRHAEAMRRLSSLCGKEVTDAEART